MSRMVKVDAIDPHPDADLFRDPENVRRLAEDIAERGIVTPLHVYPQGDRYLLLAGHDRLDAAKLLGLSEVPVDPRSMLSTEGERFAYFVKDNRLRKQFNQEQTRRLIAELLKRYAEQSDREIARMVGCHHSTVSTVRSEMESIGEISQCDRQTSDGRTYPAERKLPTPKINSNGGPAPEPAPRPEHTQPEEQDGDMATATRRTGPRIALPEGMDAEQATRAAMAMETEGASTEEAAAAFGLNPNTYRQMRYLVLLADRDDLNERDAKTAADALDYLVVHETVRHPTDMIQPLVSRIYGEARVTAPARAEHARFAAFDRAMGALTQACSMAGSLDLPHLSPDRAAQVAEELEAAEKSVRTLRHRIKELVK